MEIVLFILGLIMGGLCFYLLQELYQNYNKTKKQIEKEINKNRSKIAEVQNLQKDINNKIITRMEDMEYILDEFLEDDENEFNNKYDKEL